MTRIGLTTARLSFAALCLVLGTVPPAHGASPAGLSLAVHPTRLVLVGNAEGRFEVRNPTARELVVSASTADFLLRPSGRMVVSKKLQTSRSAKSWLTVSPSTLRLAPHVTETVRVLSHPAGNASPGDHHALVVFTTVPSGSGIVRTRTEIGLPVLVRIAGSVVRKLEIRSLTVEREARRKALRLVLYNRGNINERLLGRSVVVRLRRHGRTVARLVPAGRSILPGERAVFSVPVPERLHGAMTGEVTVRPATADVEGAYAPPYASITRKFRISV